MDNIYVFKEDVFISSLHLVKAGAKAKAIDLSKDSVVVVLVNDPFGEQVKVDRDLLKDA